MGKSRVYHQGTVFASNSTIRADSPLGGKESQQYEDADGFAILADITLASEAPTDSMSLFTFPMMREAYIDRTQSQLERCNK